MTVEMDTTGLVAGDTAGLALLSNPYAWIGVVKTAEGTTLQMVEGIHRALVKTVLRPARLSMG